jgi:hypothetical protein
MHFIELNFEGQFQIFEFNERVCNSQMIGNHFPATYLGERSSEHHNSSDWAASMFLLELPIELAHHLNCDRQVKFMTYSNAVYHYLSLVLSVYQLQIFKSVLFPYRNYMPIIDNYAYVAEQYYNHGNILT